MEAAAILMWQSKQFSIYFSSKLIRMQLDIWPLKPADAEDKWVLVLEK